MKLVLQYLRPVSDSRLLWKDLGLVSDLEAFLLGVVLVWDWEDSGFLIQTSGDSNTVMT